MPSLNAVHQNHVHELKIDAYRVLFPIAWFAGLVGVGLWLLYFYGALQVYPAKVHADIMMGLFLVFFVAGFLMTAIPRFTGTFGPEGWEVWSLLVFSAGELVTVFLNQRVYFHTFLLLALVTLFLFAVRRIRVRTSLPPPPLVFVYAGLAGAILSVCFLMASDLVGPLAVLGQWGEIFLYQVFPFLVIIGVGIFLLPMLMGHPGSTHSAKVGFPQAKGKKLTYWRLVPPMMWGVIGTLYLGCTIEVLGWFHVAHVIRSAVIILAAFSYWRLYRLPQVRTILSMGLWISCWCLVAGFLSELVMPDLDIFARHMTYVGGMGLMILMISTRVTLSHGGHDMTLESRSRYLVVMVVLTIVAAIARVTVWIYPVSSQTLMLEIASWAWVAALVFWGGLNLPRLFHVAPPDLQMDRVRPLRR